jgi:hypothetical protein
MGLKGYRLWVMGQLDSTCRAHRDGRGAGFALFTTFCCSHHVIIVRQNTVRLMTPSMVHVTGGEVPEGARLCRVVTPCVPHGLD